MPTLMKKANGERYVPDEKVAEYLALGYSVIDSTGKVLQEPEPTTIEQFRKERHKLTNEITRLQAANLALEAENAAKDQRIQELEKALSEACKQQDEAKGAETASYSAEEPSEQAEQSNSAPESKTADKAVSDAKKPKSRAAAQ